MNPLTLRAMNTFPAELQHRIRAHRYGDIDDLVQQVGLALLQAKASDTMRKIFDRGRSGTRRFTQDFAHYSRSLDAVAGLAAAGEAGDETQRGLTRREIARDLAETFGVTQQRAGQIIDEQLRRAEQGDLFLGDGSDDEGVPA